MRTTRLEIELESAELVADTVNNEDTINTMTNNSDERGFIRAFVYAFWYCLFFRIGAKESMCSLLYRMSFALMLSSGLLVD
jgi:hypothetical protein